MGRGIAQGAAAVPVGRGVWGRRQMDQQHLKDPPLDVLQQRVRDGKLPHPAGGLGDPPAEVVPVQRVADGVQRPGGDAQIPHKGEELPRRSSAFPPFSSLRSNTNCVWETAPRYLISHPQCVEIPQADSPAQRAYTPEISRPAATRGWCPKGTAAIAPVSRHGADFICITAFGPPLSRGVGEAAFPPPTGGSGSAGQRDCGVPRSPAAPKTYSVPASKISLDI